MNHRRAAGRQKLQHEVPIADRIEGIRSRRPESEVFRQGSTIDRKTTAGERSGTQWRDVGALQRVSDPALVSPKHLDIGKQVMREQHRLRPLGMGIPGHHRVELLLGPNDQRRLERGNRLE